MYWILFVMSAVAAVVIALLVGGLVTPRTHVVSRSASLDAPVDVVWSHVRDVARHAEWREVLEEVTIEHAAPGTLRWTARTTTGSERFEMTADEPPRHFAARSLDDDLSASSEWTWHVQGDARGATVTVTERGDVPNPIVRFVRTHLSGFAKPVDHYLRDLARAVGHTDVAIVSGGARDPHANA